MFAVYVGVASITLCLLLLWGLSQWSSRQVNRREESVDRDGTMGKLAWAISGGAMLLGIAIYFGFFVGQESVSSVPSATPAMSAGAEAPPGKANGGDLNTVVKRLADKMEADPKNGEGWLLLAKTYSELRRFSEADAAYEKAVALLPPDANVLANWADVHVMAKGRKWDAAGRDIVKRALAADPSHVKSLALAGNEAFDRADYKGAIAFWKRMKAAAEPGAMDSKLADTNIAEAEAVMSGKKPEADPSPAAFGPVVGGMVSLSPKLRDRVAEGDTLFVVAKAPDGKGPPLAVWKRQGKDFPVEFRLDDNAAIMPGRMISQFAEVIVSAKISKSGTAESANGDILAPAVKARVGATTLKLELSELVSGK